MPAPNPMLCLLDRTPLEPFHVFPRKALFNKPLRTPVPDAVADMQVGYNPATRHVSSCLRSERPLDGIREAIYAELYRLFVPTGLSPLQQRYTDFVADWIDRALPPRSRVLEIGCHDGYLLHRLAAAGHTVSGVEPSPFAEVARERYGLSVEQAFFTPGMIAGGSLDAVVMRHVAEHVEEPLALVRAAADALVPGGLLYIEVPNSLWSVEESFFPEFHVDHVSYFTRASLVWMLREAGLEVLHSEAATAYMRFPFLNALARRTDAPLPPAEHAWFQDFRLPMLVERFPALFGTYLENLRRLARSHRLAVWGSGSIGTQFAIDGGWGEEVVYVDLNPSNQGLRLSVSGHEIRPPEALRDMRPEVLLLATGWETDARRQAAAYIDAGTEVLAFHDLLRLPEGR